MLPPFPRANTVTEPLDSVDWTAHLLTETSDLHALLKTVRRMAVLGIRAEGHVPAYTVPEYAQRSGITIIPVPVHDPDATVILGEPVVRRVADVPPPIDLVDVFRLSHDIPPHVDDIIAAKPRAVWFQLGIRNDDAAERLARAGILVVQDRCVQIELMRMGR